MEARTASAGAGSLLSFMSPKTISKAPADGKRFQASHEGRVSRFGSGCAAGGFPRLHGGTEHRGGLPLPCPKLPVPGMRPALAPLGMKL